MRWPIQLGVDDPGIAENWMKLRKNETELTFWWEVSLGAVLPDSTTMSGGCVTVNLQNKRITIHLNGISFINPSNHFYFGSN